jgi:dihydrofolate synthase/folylpolyglutamate synthase
VDPLAFLFSLERLGMKFGLENISRLCAALDHPERAFRSVVVAGTNGKGSVTAMAETALRAAGHRAARYTSPHLQRVEERFVIDGREVATGDLVAALGRVQQAAGALVADGVLDAPPTFFECATATAFELFRRARVAIAVLEVGLGGRLDATNVVSPVAVAITSIDLDHQAQLGDTIASIAREKAGVIKPGIPVVCGELPGDADRVIADVAAGAGARVVHAAEAVAMRARSDGRVDVRSARYTLDAVALALAGAHQAKNAAVTVALLAELDRLGVAVDPDAVRAGLAGVSWPGRLERIDSGAHAILLDAAHNPAGASALAAHLGALGWTDAVLVFGAMHDKDVAAMLRALAPRCRRIVCTTARSPRAMPAGAIAALAEGAGPWAVDVEPSPADALARAQRHGHRIVAAGSIFLIGPLRDILR